MYVVIVSVLAISLGILEKSMIVKVGFCQIFTLGKVTSTRPAKISAVLSLLLRKKR